MFCLFVLFCFVLFLMAHTEVQNSFHTVCSADNINFKGVCVIVLNIVQLNIEYKKN